MTASRPVAESGWKCLLLAAAVHNLEAAEDSLRHEFGGGSLSKVNLVRAARRIGFRARIVRIDWKRLATLPLPAICGLREGGYVLLGSVRTGEDGNEEILALFPGERNSRVVSPELASDLFDGEMVLLTPRGSAGAAGTGKFGFTWFLPSIIKFRKHFGEVLAISLVVQLLALLTPLFFQVVMDKVLVHRGLTTLHVLALGILAVHLFEFLLDTLRTYLLTHTTNRMDVKLGSNLFRHLLSLPQSYFENRPVGSSVARVRELESIRHFLTSSMTTTLLDLLFVFVFIAVMFFYSLFLTLIVLCSLPVYVLLTMAVTPILRHHLQEKFNRGAVNQAFLVESVSGIAAVKAHAVESRMVERWDQQLASYVDVSFRAAHVENIGSKMVMLISKVTTVGILWFGAQMVMEGTMTIGQLIAFNMFAARVSTPVIRLAQLWQDFQQVSVGMKRLGDILDTPSENPEILRSNLPEIRGDIEFRDVSFRYLERNTHALQNINLKVKAGQRIGIVGESGSGKSTLVKILQKIYNPTSGRVLVDGIDLSLAHPEWLRRQTGVVLQENRLFTDSIRLNIAFSDSSVPMERVIEAAKLAGAHDFIVELERGYETRVEEAGVNLSGGQRQRIAIARALVTNPRILILDEATSALDYETESVIQGNMRRIAEKRTVLIVSHRLSVVRDCDLIIVMKHGEIVESGTHEELRAVPNGLYAHFHNLQFS